MGRDKSVDKRFPKSFGREKDNREVFIDLAHGEELSPKYLQGERIEEKKPPWLGPVLSLEAPGTPQKNTVMGLKEQDQIKSVYRSTQNN